MPNTAQNVEIKDSGKPTATTFFDLKVKKKVPFFSSISDREICESEFIPYSCHYDDETLLTKSGDLVQILKIDGLAFETSDHGWLDFQKNIRNTLLRSISKNRYAVYIHTIRKKEKLYPEGDFPSGFSCDLNKAWKKKHSDLELYLNDFYITLIRKENLGTLEGFSDKISDLFDSFFNKSENKESQKAEKYKLAHKELCSVSSRFLANLKNYGARLLGITEGYSETIQFLSYLINLEDRKSLVPSMDLSKYLPSKRLFFGKDALEIRGINSSKLAALLSVKEYCDSSRSGLLDSFLELPCEFVMTQSFLFADRQNALNKIQLQQRKMKQTEDLAVSQIEEIDQALDDATAGKIGFGYHHLTVLVTAKTHEKLDKALSQIEATFLNLGIVAVREDLNLEPCFWAQLPGNFSFISRSSLISTANLAGFASLHNYPSGKLYKNHWGPAVTILETLSGTPYFFNFHLADVGHTCIIGPTGTGKSVLLNFLIAQSFKFKPKIYFFDKDRGGEIFIRAMKGSHSTLGTSSPSGFNPLKLPDNSENRAFLAEWLALLLSSSGEILSAENLKVISEAVNGNYSLDSQDRTLKNLASFLGLGGAGSLASRLDLWYGKGTHKNLFDNEEDQLNFNQPLSGFEMGEILGDTRGLPPTLAYLFHRIHLSLSGDPTILVLEEGWKLLDNPYFAPKIKDWLQTIRKRNGFVIFLTPNIESVINSSIGDTLVQQSSTSIFLPNHKATEESYCGAFKLSEKELHLIRSMNPADHTFLIKHGKDSIIAKLNLSGFERFLPILSATSKNVSILDEIRKEYGDNPSAWMEPFLERVK